MSSSDGHVAEEPTADPSTSSHDTPVTHWRVVVLCALVCLLNGYVMVIGPVATPTMALDWAIDVSRFGMALAASILGMAIGSVMLAPLGDRFGRRPLILWSFALVGVSTLAIVAWQSVTGFTLLRFITGLGLGASLANALTLTSENAATAIRSRVLACVYASSAVGGALGGLVAPWIMAVGGWQGLFVAGGVVPLLLVPLLMLRLPESVRFIAARASRAAPTAARGTASMTDMLASVTALFSVEYRKATILIWLLFFLSTFTTYMISSWLPTLMSLAGWSMDNAVRALMMFSFGGIIGGFLLSWVVDRGRVKAALLAGFAITALALGLLGATPPNVSLWMALITLMGIGVIGAANALTAVAAIVYPTRLRAGGIGSAGALGRFGATLAPLVGGLLIAVNVPAIGILTGLVFPMVLGLLLVLCFSRHLHIDRPGVGHG